MTAAGASHLLMRGDDTSLDRRAANDSFRARLRFQWQPSWELHGKTRKPGSDGDCGTFLEGQRRTRLLRPRPDCIFPVAFAWGLPCLPRTGRSRCRGRSSFPKWWNLPHSPTCVFEKHPPAEYRPSSLGGSLPACCGAPLRARRCGRGRHLAAERAENRGHRITSWV